MNPPLAVQPPFVDNPAFSHIGALYGASLLRRLGLEVRLADAFKPGSVARRGEDGVFIGRSPEETAEELNREESDLCLVNYSSFQRARTLASPELASLVASVDRARHPRVVLADFSLGESLYFPYDPAAAARRTGADAALPGDFFDALRPFLGGSGGLAEKMKGGRGRLDLEWLPTAEIAAFLQEAGPFGLIKEYAGESPLFPLSASFGCVYQCSFCFRKKSARSLVPLPDLAAELDFLAAKNIRRVFILDPLPNHPAERFSALLDLFQERNLTVYFVNGVRVDLLDRPLIEKLARVSAVLPVSIESGDQAFADRAVRKMLRLPKAAELLETAAGSGLRAYAHYMIGFPGENLRQVNATLSFARDMYVRFGVAPRLQFFVPVAEKSVYRRTGENRISFEHFQARPFPRLRRLGGGTLRALMSRFQAQLDGTGRGKVIVDLTRRCNNNCVICAVGDRERRDGDLDSILARLRRACLAGATDVDVDGGEPTIHPRFFELLEELERLRPAVHVRVTTNGRMLSYPGFARKLSRFRVDLLVSLYSLDEAVHDRITRSPGSLGETLKGIANALPLFPSVGINTTITAHNWRGLAAVAAFAADRGAASLNLRYLSPLGSAERSQAVPLRRASRAVKRVIDRFGEKTRINLVHFPHCHLTGYEQYLAKDLFKMTRLIVDEREVNLADFLGEKRYYTKRCAGCVHHAFCAGLWRF